MSELDEETALAAQGGGRYTGQLTDRWRIGSAVNGGLVLALVTRAMQQELAAAGPARDAEMPWPLSVTGYYLTPSTAGPVTVDVEVVRVGRSLQVMTARLGQSTQRGVVERLRATAMFGDPGDGEVHTTAEPPGIPPPQDCLDADSNRPTFFRHAELLERVDVRMDPATSGWVSDQPSGLAEMRGWLRLADGRPHDALSLLLAVDALPPVAFELGLPGWTPTLELTVHLRARPAPGWLLARTFTQNLAGGLLEEDAEVWDAAGRLVAQSRQLAKVSMPIRR